MLGNNMNRGKAHIFQHLSNHASYYIIITMYVKIIYYVNIKIDKQINFV